MDLALRHIRRGGTGANDVDAACAVRLDAGNAIAGVPANA
jgi:hypothetical protein